MQAVPPMEVEIRSVQRPKTGMDVRTIGFAILRCSISTSNRSLELYERGTVIYTNDLPVKNHCVHAKLYTAYTIHKLYTLCCAMKHHHL
jgi:hypothetical protein